MDLTRTEAYSTHDLIEFPVEGYENALPAWVDRLDGRAWAVVRRPRDASADFLAAGVRGRERAERVAVDIRVIDITTRLRPEELSTRRSSRLDGTDVAEALRLLAANAGSWFGDRAWGPVGSLGFELATGLPVVRGTSDVDLIVRVAQQLSPAAATEMVEALASLPCRADCLLETPGGAVALAEWAAADGGEVLLRTANGPSLTRDPWAEVSTATPT